MSGAPKVAEILDLGEGLNAVDIWQSLHSGERAWVFAMAKQLGLDHASHMDASDALVMRRLSNFPAARWISLCDGAGWSPVHCAALSWCKEATLGDVLTHWSKYPKVGDIVERAALFIKPELLPPLKMSELVKASQHGLLALAVLIAARIERPEMDIASHVIENHEILVDLLKSRKEVSADEAS